MISLALGVRNLARNRWRSGLTLGAVAVAVALMVWTVAFYEGWLGQMVRGATAVETSQIQIHRSGYIVAPRIYRSFSADPSLLNSIEGVPGVLAVSPRVEMFGLVGNEQRSQVVRVLGVDPEREAQTAPVTDGIINGNWLPPNPAPSTGPLPVVLGDRLARQLQVVPGDELVVFLEASDGSLGNDVLVVTGILKTGDIEIDRTTMYLPIADAQQLGALEGQVHEIAIRTDDPYDAPKVAEEIALVTGSTFGESPGATARDEYLVVRPWQDILPEINEMIILFRRSYWVMYLLVYLVAAIGVLNTQRMAALERRREFGLMIAIGMRPRRLMRTLVVETAVLGVTGAAIGAVLGGGLAWYHTAYGLNMALFTTEAAFSYMGVAFSDRIFFSMSLATVAIPVMVMVAVTLLSGCWPGIQAARIAPAPTISGRVT
jgi:ABC-type lipoprotein release transport system permease subunit